MKKVNALGLLVILLVSVVWSLPVHASTCTATGFFRDGINMTAALINPAGTVTGTVDATGCNVGVYYDSGVGQVSNANIYGANYFGVVVNGDVNTVTVNVTASQFHDIGETPLNGDQHGVAIYYRAFGTGTTSGNISNNTVYHYQKGGIVTNGPGTTVRIKGNTVKGQGPVTYIAQNGIQVGYGATATVERNTVSDNSYSGTNNASSGGILVVGGPCYGGNYTVGTQIVGNTVVNNDVGAFISNLNGACGIPSTPTNVKIINNTISDNAVNNISGNGYPIGYQAGVSDVGNNDKIVNNDISGIGYSPCLPSFCAAIDVTFTNKAKVHANSVSP
ncbi:MAG: right-handed parallel beta-helix repeat-containing protein [Aggregatilineales bacterium]